MKERSTKHIPATTSVSVKAGGISISLIRGYWYTYRQHQKRFEGHELQAELAGIATVAALWDDANYELEHLPADGLITAEAAEALLAEIYDLKLVKTLGFDAEALIAGLPEVLGRPKS